MVTGCNPHLVNTYFLKDTNFCKSRSWHRYLHPRTVCLGLLKNLSNILVEPCEKSAKPYKINDFVSKTMEKMS